MKIKRQKKARKILQLYRIWHNFRPPYRVAVDAEFLQAAIEGKILLREQLPALFEHDAQAFATPCVLKELEAGGKFYKGATQIARSLPFLKCRHAGTLTAAECVKKLVDGGNPDFLCVGAQDAELRGFLARQPGVPILSIYDHVPLLHAPSAATQRAAEQQVAARAAAREDERAAVARATDTGLTPLEAARLASGVDPQPRPTRKRAKGPNPLSVKTRKPKRPRLASPPRRPGGAADEAEEPESKGEGGGDGGGDGSALGDADAQHKPRRRRGRRGRARKGVADATEGASQPAGDELPARAERALESASASDADEAQGD